MSRIYHIAFMYPALGGAFTLPDGSIGTPYIGSITGTGGTGSYTYLKTAGPSWMTVNTSTGAITGTPDATGTGILVTVQITDSGGAMVSVSDTLNISVASDPFFADVISLLHMGNGTPGGTTFTDVIPGRTWTNVGTAAEFVSDSDAYGATAGADLVGLQLDTSSDFAIGTDDYTWEIRVKFLGTNPVPNLQGIGSNYINPDQGAPNTGGASGWGVLYNTAVSGISFYSGVGPGPVASFPWVPVVGQYYHVAICRSGTDLRCFIDGVQIGSTVTNSTNIQVTIGPGLGDFSRPSSFGYTLQAYAKEWRLTRAARYTSNFTPPAAPYPDS
jgi:hypothetical protein